MAKVHPFDVDSGTAQDKHFANEVRKALESISSILLNISPLDNFNGLYWEGTIAANTEQSIAHRLKSIPKGYIIVFCQGGTVQAGDTSWTKTHVYIKNVNTTTAAVVRIFFFL